jgi:ligand-binding sensor domain-containing protein
MENGLPQNTVQALAQTKDGFLWLGTESGLVRFDGVEFQTYDRNSAPALPGSDIRCLLVAPDGALWIGTNAGLARWKDEVVRAFTTQDGLPGNGILALRETGDGKVGAWTEQGPAQQDGDRFEAVRNVDAFPRTALPSPGEYPGAIAFEDELSNGVLVMGDRSSLSFLQGKDHPQVKSQIAVGRELPGSRIQIVFADREGAVWIGTNAGLVRWVKGKVERFPITDPLATASILAVMEDSEGNLWVGTETSGLDILRDQRFRTIDTRDGLNSDRITTVVEDAAGTLWVGTQENGLNALLRDQGTASMHAVRSLYSEQRPREQCDSVAGCGAERRPLGGHAGWVEPDSRKQGGHLHLSRWAA